MKTRLISLGFFALVAVASAKDDKVSLIRAYKADETVVYSVQIDQMLGTTQISMMLREHVLKVNQDGSADCELVAGQISHTTNGVASEPIDGKPFAARFDRSGSLLTAPSGLMSMPFLVGGPSGLDGGLGVGQAVPFNRQDPGAKDMRLKGVVTLVSVTDGVATVTATADRIDQKNVPTEHIEGTFIYTVKGGSMTKSDVVVTERKRPRSGRTHIISELQTN